MDKLDRALYDTVHDYSGGAPALAKRTGENPGTLQNRVDPTQERHHPTVRGALSWMLTTGDYRILFALASECGYGCSQLGDFADCSDMELLDRLMELGAKRGDVDRALHEAFADRVLTRAEFEDIDERIDQAIRSNLELKTRLRALVQDEAPRYLQAVASAVPAQRETRP